MKTVTYDIYPLFEIEKQKIDHRNLKRALFDEYGCLTAASENFGIACLTEKFNERNEQEKYEISAELTFCDLNIHDFRVLFGEKGVFLKYNKSLEFQNVLTVIKLFEKLVTFEFSKQVNRILNMKVIDKKISGKKYRIFVRVDS